MQVEELSEIIKVNFELKELKMMGQELFRNYFIHSIQRL